MRIVFMGTPESAVPSLRRLVDDGHEIVSVWTQPDRPAGRGKKLHQSPVKEFARERNLTLHQPQKIRTPEAKELFTSHKADLAVVVAYGKILPNEFLTAPRQGCVNVHFSLLPKYRGAAPVNWAIVNGEEQTGVTTMRVVERLDAGPILLQKATEIGERETAPELLSRLSEMGAELISETLRNLNDIEPKPQHDSEATLAPFLKREDGLVDWTMGASAIERRIRGFQPWPNAHTTFSSRRLILWQAEEERSMDATAVPGQIIEAHGDNFMVACGEATALRILEVQPESGRSMSARDFINGLQPRAGNVLRSESWLSDSQNHMNLKNFNHPGLLALLVLLSPAVAMAQSICPDPEKPCGSFKPYELSFRIPPGKLARPEDRSAAFYAIILKSAAPCSIADDQRKAAQADFPRNKVFISRFECEPEDIISYATIDDRKYSILAVYAGSTRRQAEAFLSRVRTTGSYPDAYLRRMTVVRVHP